MSFSPSQLTLLTSEQKATYDAYQRLFATPGWALVQDRVNEQFGLLAKAYDGVAGEQHLGRVQGGRIAYNEILKLEDVIEHEYALLLEETTPQEPEGWEQAEDGA